MRKALFILVLAAALLGVVAGCSSGGNPAEKSSVEPAEDAFASARGWIAFREGAQVIPIDHQIIAVDPANPTNTVVLGRSLDDDPIGWSSDGAKLLLRSELGLEGEFHGPLPGLFILHANGSRTTVLPETESWGRGPPTWGSFSPDGTKVAYATIGRSRGPYIVAAEGGKRHALGRPCPHMKIGGRRVEVCSEGSYEAAAWSPDGSRIAWADFVEDSAKYGHDATALSFVNPDGTGLREEVAPLIGEAYSLVWSPDGSRLAFGQIDGSSHRGQIFVVNADGSSLQQITREGDNRWPAWSPDGSRIAYVHDGTLSTMARDGTDVETLKGVTPNGAIAWNPAE